MNALVGQEAKANFSLFWRLCDSGADVSEGDASSRFFMTAPRNCNRQE
jgi:hypothetical protein